MTDELRIVLNADDNLPVEMQDATPLSLSLQNRVITVTTDDYTALQNKPSINGTTLTGDKTTADLGLQAALNFDAVPTNGSSNPVTSDGVYDAVSGKVAKAGDTMTGNLTLQSGAKLAVMSADIDITATPESGKNQDVAVGTDKNGDIINFMRSIQDASGNTGVEFNARRSVGGSTYFNGVTFKIAPDATRSVAVSDPGAWRSAIGAVNKGGDTMTGNLTFDNGNYKGINLKGGSGAPSINMYNTGTRLTLDEYASGSTGGERYLLPIPESRGSDAWYDIYTSKDGIFKYKEQSVSVSLTANAFTTVGITQLSEPTNYSYLSTELVYGNSASLRNKCYILPNSNRNAILIYATETMSGTIKLRTWFVLTSATKEMT